MSVGLASPRVSWFQRWRPQLQASHPHSICPSRQGRGQTYSFSVCFFSLGRKTLSKGSAADLALYLISDLAGTGSMSTQNQSLANTGEFIQLDHLLGWAHGDQIPEQRWSFLITGKEDKLLGRSIASAEKNSLQVEKQISLGSVLIDQSIIKHLEVI